MAAELTSHQKKMAELLHLSVKRLAERYGVERIGFFTLTFKERGISAKEAQRRWHSLRSNVISKRFSEFVRVRERQKDGTIHYHLVVVLSVDIRTGVDFKAFEAMDYSSASKALKAEWSFWRRTCMSYGFGRHELLPVKSTAEGIARYVGKYVAKDVGARLAEDKGARLVEFSKGARCGTSRFSRASKGSWLWRHKVKAFAEKHRCFDLVELAALFGPHWAFHQRDAIMATRLNSWPTAGHCRADSTGEKLPSDVPDDAGPIYRETTEVVPFTSKAKEQRKADWEALHRLPVATPEFTPVPPPPSRRGDDWYTPPGQDCWYLEVVKDRFGNVMRDDKKRIRVRWRLSGWKSALQ